MRFKLYRLLQAVIIVVFVYIVFWKGSPKRSNPRRTPTPQIPGVFISVKTTQIYHQTRIKVILKTWYNLAQNQTYFFTDSDVWRGSDGHVINTKCSASHSRKALCCKMSVEFDTFLDTDYRWFCHFDDDSYVNIPRLAELLQGFNPLEDWYLGKPSIRSPLQIIDRQTKEKLSFRFGTGGAGFCISRSLAFKMMPYASGGKLISIGENLRLPDDVTIGYIIEHVLNKKLHVVEGFHSHLEPMKYLKPEEFHQQITFSYSGAGKHINVVNVEGFDEKVDPTRFYSLHCYLFPEFSFCPG